MPDTGNQTIRCRTSSGLGGNFGFNVSNGRHWVVSPDALPRSQYADATIAGVRWSPEPATDGLHKDNGGAPGVAPTVLTITGANFGPQTTPGSGGLTVKYAYPKVDPNFGTLLKETQFAASACAVKTTAAAQLFTISAASAPVN